jgi:hypothetical protein
MKVLSIDCGIVSMSISIFDICDDNIKVLLLKTTDITKWIIKDKPYKTMGSVFEHKEALPRVDATMQYINNILLPNLLDMDTFILIEKQIPATATYDIMITLYAVLLAKGYKNVKIIHPNLKNNYVIDIGITEFASKYTQKYYANKMFALYNFNKMIKVLDCSSLVSEYSNAYKKDIADSFMQAIAWLESL